MLPFVRPALAALLFAVPPVLLASARLFGIAPARLAPALMLVALPFALAGAYASGWVVRPRSTGDALFRGAMVGLSGVVNVCLVGFLLARGGHERLGTDVLATGVFLALPALATGALAAWLHRRWWT